MVLYSMSPTLLSPVAVLPPLQTMEELNLLEGGGHRGQAPLHPSPRLAGWQGQDGASMSTSGGWLTAQQQAAGV